MIFTWVRTYVQPNQDQFVCSPRNDGLNVITGVKAQRMCNVANKDSQLCKAKSKCVGLLHSLPGLDRTLAGLNATTSVLWTLCLAVWHS